MTLPSLPVHESTSQTMVSTLQKETLSKGQTPPRRRDPAEKRARLLKAARDLFIEQGFEKTTTKKIVERSGVSEGVLFHQFGSKLGVFRELIRVYAQNAIAEFAPVVEDDLSAEIIIRNLIAYIDQDKAMFALVDRSEELLKQNNIPTVADLVIAAIEDYIRTNVATATQLPADPSVMAEFQYFIVVATYRGWLKARTKARKEAFIQEGVRSMNALMPQDVIGG